MTERQYLYIVTYQKKFYKYVWATTKWHAFDLVYWRMALDIPKIDRSKIRVKKHNFY